MQKFNVFERIQLMKITLLAFIITSLCLLSSCQGNDTATTSLAPLPDFSAPESSIAYNNSSTNEASFPVLNDLSIITVGNSVIDINQMDVYKTSFEIPYSYTYGFGEDAVELNPVVEEESDNGFQTDITSTVILPYNGGSSVLEGNIHMTGQRYSIQKYTDEISAGTPSIYITPTFSIEPTYFKEPEGGYPDSPAGYNVSAITATLETSVENSPVLFSSNVTVGMTKHDIEVHIGKPYSCMITDLDESGGSVVLDIACYKDKKDNYLVIQYSEDKAIKITLYSSNIFSYCEQVEIERKFIID